MKSMRRTASTLAATAALVSTAAAQTPPPKPAIGSDQAIGQQFRVAADPLPEPYKGGAVRNAPLLVPRNGRKPTVPDGFEATLYADGLKGARQMAVLPNGDVVVSVMGEGNLLMLRDQDGDGKADWIERHAAGFNLPYGLAYRTGEILVADQDGIWGVPYGDGLLRPPFAEVEPIGAVPAAERRASPDMDGQKRLTAKGVFGIAQGHLNKSLKVGPDGRLYAGVGSVGNIGEEPSPKATIQVFSASGQGQQTFASGTRNPSGLAFQPGTGDLWAVVQERDGLGGDLVPDFLTRVKAGGFYGFPYAYIGPHPQTGFAERAPDKVKATIVPDLLFAPHSAAFGMAFYDGAMFPPAYVGDAFVALHGSWNREEPTGYKVVRVRFEGGEPVGGYENFATGFWVSGKDRAEVWGRPADVAVAKDGALLVLDDTGGTIWRIAHAAAAPK